MKKQDILKVLKGKVFLGEEEISQGEIKNLWGEIQSWKQFRLREIFLNSLEQYAITEGFKGSTSWETTLHFKGLADAIGRMKAIEDLIEKLAKGAVQPKEKGTEKKIIKV